MTDDTAIAAQADHADSSAVWPRRWYLPVFAMLAVGCAVLAFFAYSSTVHIEFGIFPRPPMYGYFRPKLAPAALWVIPAGLLLAGTAWLVSSAKRIAGWLALSAVVAAGVATAAAVALVRGNPNALIRGVSTAPHTFYYTTELHFIDEYGVRGFVQHYPELITKFFLYNAKTHPAGVLVFLNLVFQTLGRSHPLRIATALAVIALSAAVAVWSMGRELGGDRAGRIAAVLFVAAPGPLLLAYTNLDVIFAAVISAALALVMMAIHRTSPVLAAGAGAVLALSTLMTYATMFVAIAVAIAVAIQAPTVRTAARLLGAAAGAGLAVLVIARLTLGFDLVATYRAMPKSRTPYDLYWTFAHPAALLTWAGLPLAALGIAGLLIKVPGARRATLPLVLVVVMLVWGTLPAAVTGLRYGEVERTWAFLYPVLAAAAGPVVDRWSRRAGRWSGAVVAGLVVLSVAQTAVLQALWDNLL